MMNNSSRKCFERLMESIYHGVRSYWGVKKNETLKDLGRHTKSVKNLQYGSSNTGKPCRNVNTENRRWKSGCQGDKIKNWVKGVVTDYFVSEERIVSLIPTHFHLCMAITTPVSTAVVLASFLNDVHQRCAILPLISDSQSPHEAVPCCSGAPFGVNMLVKL